MNECALRRTTVQSSKNIATIIWYCCVHSICAIESTCMLRCAVLSVGVLCGRGGFAEPRDAHLFLAASKGAHDYDGDAPRLFQKLRQMRSFQLFSGADLHTNTEPKSVMSCMKQLHVIELIVRSGVLFPVENLPVLST